MSLSQLLLTPFAGALLVLLVPGNYRVVHRFIALVTSAITAIGAGTALFAEIGGDSLATIGDLILKVDQALLGIKPRKVPDRTQHLGKRMAGGAVTGPTLTPLFDPETNWGHSLAGRSWLRRQNAFAA